MIPASMATGRGIRATARSAARTAASPPQTSMRRRNGLFMVHSRVFSTPTRSRRSSLRRTAAAEKAVAARIVMAAKA